MSKSILINYAGYPISPRNFVPDNGMAALAGALLARGHRTLVLDYSTVDIIRRIFPYQYGDELASLTDRILRELRGGGRPAQGDMERFYALDEAIDRYQQARVTDIAREIDALVKARGADFVGMKLFVGDAFEGSVAIAEYLKRANPGLRIFGGGPHVDWFMHRIFDVTDAFDALAYGEGEETIVQLAEYARGHRRLEEIPNLVFRRNGRVVVTPQRRIEDLNALPYPVYDAAVYPAMKGNDKIKMVLVDESRGCPNSCNFCCHPGKSGSRWRMRRAEGVVDVMEQISYNYAISAFRFAGSSPPPALKKEIAREILRRGLPVRYTSFAHARSYSSEDFELIRRSGCYATFFGIESGSQEILDRSMNKKISVQQVRDAVKKCRAAGMKIVGSIIMPAPLETERTKAETAALLAELRLDAVDVCFPTPVPGTRWGDEGERFGFSIPDRERFWMDTMTYRIKTFYPQALWKPHPLYYLNGKPFADVAMEATEFVGHCERQGMLTQVTDEVLLMADCAGMDAREFRDLSNRCLARGDADGMAQLVERVNRSTVRSRAPAG
jgi:magnesium-protoporphyrin IX monomethyl ester (oxidative) cyclase